MAFEFDGPEISSLVQPVDYNVHDFLHCIPAKKKEELKCVSVASSSDVKSSLLNINQSDVYFHKQLDEIALWFEKWTHAQRCSVLEYLVAISGFSQFQLLHTTVQPILHRDFMYNARGRFPDDSFMPISTESSRAIRQRLVRNRLINKYHRTKSAYVRDETDVKTYYGFLPLIKNKQSQKELFKDPVVVESKLRLPSLHHRRSLTDPIDHMDTTVDNPNASWLTTMQVRRHLQEEMNDVQISEQVYPPNAKKLYQWYSSWTGPQRATFLQLALKKLDSRQLYYLSTFLSVRSHRDVLTLLPPRLAHRILSYLSPADLVNCAKVSHAWNELCAHNFVWKQKCSETQLDIRPIRTPRFGGWKSAFRRDTLLKQNWKKGHCTMLHLIGHSDSVLCLTFNNKIILSGSKDCTACIWSISTGRLIHTFVGHQKGIWAVAIITNHLVASGSYDKTVKIWGYGSSRASCLRTLYGHQGPIWL
ncbi:unnamed protein product [Clavelina lepadiformis]|uniref:F-box domain-containing protein n=1 Tax=Clavelina lepadiformis TaxID=159417 RepID=A0ABP0FUF4_CLALP